MMLCMIYTKTNVHRVTSPVTMMLPRVTPANAYDILPMVFPSHSAYVATPLI